MSNYRDFVHDFAARCEDVLTAFSDPAKARDREVTLLLMATTAGLVMPYERLSEGDAIKQPPLDRPNFAAASARLQGLLGETIGQSQLFEEQDSWRAGPLGSAAGTPDNWPELVRPTPLSRDATVSFVMRGMRNGLAHGNVFTRAASRGEISELVFIAGGTKRNGDLIPLRYVLVSPDDLRRFLSSWFTAISELPLPHHQVLRMVDEAA